MKPFALLLLLAIVVVVITSGCLSSTPEKKVVPTTVVTTLPVTHTTLPPSSIPTTTQVQTIVTTPEITVTYDDVIIPEPTIDTPNLRVIKYNEARPEVGRLIITGIAKNDGKTSVPLAEVQIKFYDANNHLITSAKDTTYNFEAGGTWGFTIEYPGPDSRKVYSYKVSIDAGPQ
jgi:hypothetical protein